MELREIFYYIKRGFLLLVRFVIYTLDGILFDPGKLKMFQPNSKKFIAYASNGKEYSLFDPKYWNIQWMHWKDSKKIGKEYYKDVVNIINNISKNVFEVGCGPGYLIEFLDSHINYVGIDISSEAINMAKRKVKNENFKFYVDNIENMEFYLKNRNFDTFIAIDVLEHLETNLLNLVIETIIKNNFKHVLIVTPYLNFVSSPGHIQNFSKFKMKCLYESNYTIDYKPYKFYSEFLTILEQKKKT